MLAWRRDCRAALRYTGAVYEHAALQWTQTSYMQPQAHLFDRYLFNETSSTYTVDRYLDDVTERYGGIDSILLWPTYPNIGLDDRNQFDMITTVPGGLPALRAVVARFHARGVRVLWPIKPWDTGTRRDDLGEYGQMIQILQQTDADGLNGDTYPWVPRDVLDRALRDYRPIALEPELGGVEYDGRLLNDWLNWHTMSWGYWKYPSGAPLIAKWKWFEPRHMTHVCQRWRTDHTANLHAAWLSGVGFETWENVFGTWNGLTPRDAEAVRRMGRVLRLLGPDGYLTSAGWVPHAPLARLPDSRVHASYFPHPTPRMAERGHAFVAVVPADASTDTRGALLAVPCQLASSAVGLTPPPRFYDLLNGRELTPVRVADEAAVLQIDLSRWSVGGILITTLPPTGALKRHLRTAARDAAHPLAKRSAAWAPLPQRIVYAKEDDVDDDHANTDGARRGGGGGKGTRGAGSSKHGQTPHGMVRIPEAAAYHFKCRGVIIEPEETSENYAQMKDAVDVQLPWETHPQRVHEHTLAIAPFYMDVHPVTCEAFRAYLSAHTPTLRDATRFLHNWPSLEKETITVVEADGASSTSSNTRTRVRGGTYPPGHARKPVTYVSLADARAYCRALGKRLPRSVEWQYAAQGTDGRAYPWGDADDTSGHRYPPEVKGQQLPPPADVDAHTPQGGSPFGVADLIGNTWEYMAETFVDEHTRAVLVRGGSNYRPAQPGGYSSQWYFPQAKRLDEHNKYFLMGDAYERAGTLGFRCAVDAG